MGALKRLGASLAAAALLLASGANARDVERWRPLASEAAARFRLPEAWVLAVIEAESAGRTAIDGRPTTSHAGAMGLMQIMPGTWTDLRATYRLGSNPHDPADNIVAGTAYLRAMYDRFGYPGLFAAYNAGPGRYGEYVARGRPLPRETRDYVAKIVGRGHALPAGAVAARIGAAPESVSAPPIFARSAEPPRKPRQANDSSASVPVPVEPPRAADAIFLFRRTAAAGRE